MTPAAALAEDSKTSASQFSDLFELTKPRITFMVVLTAGIGALLASRGDLSLVMLAHALIGTALVSGGASAFNQVLEHEVDARMRRTAQRPIPAGRMSTRTGWVFSLTLSAIGVAYLIWAVNVLTAVLGMVALLSYVLIYTPLKRLSSLSTLVGAVPGAIPPMMGWTAIAGRLEPGAWALFGILFFWQLPHFLAIAWLCREDYGQAGFPMLSVTDTSGRRTARQMILYSLALLPVSLAPTALGLTGMAYFGGALVLGILFLAFSLNFARSISRAAARRVMAYSVLYLPLVLGVMVLDRVL